MSHLTTFKNNALVDTKRGMLSETVKEIGLILDYDKKNVENSFINEPVDGCFMRDGNYLSVGVRFSTNDDGQEEVTIAGDFWGTGLEQEALTNQIAQVYQKNRIIDLCSEAHWFMDDNAVVTNTEGDIEITAYRYA